MSCQKLVSQFNALSKKTAENKYEMCRIIHTVRESQLFFELEYEDFKSFVEGETNVTKATADRYCAFYTCIYWHDFSKKDAVSLLEQIGLNATIHTLRDMVRGATVSSVVANAKAYNNYQMPLTMTPSDRNYVEKTLQMFGAVEYETGIVRERGTALLALCKAARKNRTTTLKAVS